MNRLFNKLAEMTVGVILKLLGWGIVIFSLGYAGLGALNVGGDPASGFWREMLLLFAVLGAAVGGGLVVLGAVISGRDS